MIIVSAFLIPRRETPELLEAVDQPLDPVALAVDRPIVRSHTPFIRLARDRVLDPASPQVRPDLAAAVALVADDAVIRIAAGMVQAPYRPLFCGAWQESGQLYPNPLQLTPVSTTAALSLKHPNLLAISSDHVACFGIR